MAQSDFQFRLAAMKLSLLDSTIDQLESLADMGSDISSWYIINTSNEWVMALT